jgi:hypothetical protein
MHRLTEESRKRILKILDYTPSELSVISQVREVPLVANHTIPVDYCRHSTIEGVSKQLDDFTARIGLIYLFTFDWPNKSFELSKIPVECNRPWEPVTN